MSVRKPNRKKGKFSKIIITAIILLNILFTIAVLVVFWHTSTEPIALVGCFFGFTTCELWALAGIKKCKMNNENQNTTEN